MKFSDGNYRSFVRRRFGLPPRTRDLRHAVGGEFAAFGVVEREMLRHYGLQPADRLIDVGCGAGRLTAALRDWFEGTYLATDVVPDLITAARALGRPAWRFERVDGIGIPASDASADMVCFFSVLTHLLYEDAFRYLAEARRVLRPGGRIVFSFLEFRDDAQWPIFAASVDHARRNAKRTLNVFLSREAIETWASRLDLRVVDMRPGSERFVPLPEPVTLDSGEVMAGLGCLGQSVCALERP